MGFGIDGPNLDVALARARLDAPHLDASRRPGDDPELAEAATQFEALLMKQLVVALRDSAKLGGDGDENVMTEHLIEDALATHLARSGGVGLADIIVRDADGALRPNTTPFVGLGLGPTVSPVHDVDRAANHPDTPSDALAAPSTSSLPLAERLPPDHDAWLGDEDAAGTLRRLLGPAAKKIDPGP